MDLGAVVGSLSSLASIAATGWLIQRHYSRPRSWSRAAADAGTVAVANGLLLGCDYVTILLLNATDSSHGVVSLGMPVVVGGVATLIAATAFTIGARDGGKTGRQRTGHP